MNWIRLAQDRNKWRAVVNTGDEISSYIKCVKLLE